MAEDEVGKTQRSEGTYFQYALREQGTRVNYRSSGKTPRKNPPYLRTRT